MKRKKYGGISLFLRLLCISLALLLTGCATIPGNGSGTSGGTDPESGSDSAPEETTPDETESESVPGSGTPAPEIPEVQVSLDPLAVPVNSAQFSMPFAMQALALCSGHTAERQTELLTSAGFTVLLQKNYDKEAADPSHTSAYTVAKRTVSVGGISRTLLLVAIRGTSAGEWYSNFDFAPSHSNDAAFAENFLLAAEDILPSVRTLADTEENPLLLICGHSRGGACANLLGMLLNAVYGTERVYTYTFATPATVRTDNVGTDCKNIFNVINPSDLVIHVPLSAWGYHRLGTDILLPADAETAAHTEKVVHTLSGIAPTVSQYYEERHSLTSPGLSEYGLTTFEVMLTLVRSMLSGSEGTDSSDASSAPASGGLDLSAVPENSDFGPLVVLLKNASADGGAAATKVLSQHLPALYLYLMSETLQK